MLGAVELSATECVMNVNAYMRMYKHDRSVPSLSGTQRFTFYVLFTALKMFALFDFVDVD